MAGPCRGASTCLMFVSGGALSEGYRHDGPGICLGDGQTEGYLKDTGMAGLASAFIDGQTEAYLKDMVMTGLAAAWVIARRRLKEYRRQVDAATRCSGVCPHT